MDLTQSFPNLESVAQANGTSLPKLAAKPTDPSAFLNLAASCWWVASDLTRQNVVADPYGYLATLEAFLSSFAPSELPRAKFWNKVKNPNDSAFLDTVAEAAFSLYLRQSGQQIRVEEPFSAASGSKDADILLTSDGNDYWLDVICIDPQQPVIANGFVVQTPATLAHLFSRSIESKYDRKFRDAVANGPLQGKNVGVLACILKYEAAFIPLLMTGQPLPPPSPQLFANCPGLVVGWVHSLRKLAADSDLLVPIPLLKWSRP
ncbi:hypothetical protein [Melittangium boletus]|uniref:Uncharacterized protein n=1 Tax=Melittangium boletus DSM 14713 TaxID=1294270 RepID=A0A250ILQ6_9BACT|nr:hypothetical protein [Melittangium boletus]ATB32107.1 hypothetical protein MEBOL_005583 [Melittangium boletus DSM 14713]